MKQRKTGKDDKPPSARGPWKIAIIANIKDEHQARPANVPIDAFADFDHIETIDAIRNAIETDNHKTIFIEATSDLPNRLQDEKPDICFNIAEGLGGDAREAQVPALLEMLGIPYTGSRVMTNAIALDKTLTKRIWRDRNLPVAPFQEFSAPNEHLRQSLRFPLFVKPAREGTGMGVDMHAKVETEAELRERVAYIVENYKQPALVESYLPGREFTIGQIGRPDAKEKSRHPEWYSPRGFHQFSILELESSRSATPGIYSNEAKSRSLGEEGAPQYLCPANLNEELARKMKRLALRAHNLLGALDVSRVDVRLDAEGNPRLIEINPLPGLTPGYSDLCIQAAADGIAYEELILEILYLGASRWGLY